MWRRATLILLLAGLCLLGCPCAVDAAKKKKGRAKKAASSASLDPVRCGVCVQAVDEMLKELATTENSTSTLDMRWGLTATVTDGRAKRIGKVIKYNRSELRAVEVMEAICSKMRSFERYEGVKGEVQLKTREQLKALQPHATIGDHEADKEAKKKDQNRFERFCEELTENSEKAITKAIKDELTAEQFVDAVCHGQDDAPCGGKRTSCAPGSYSAWEGEAQGLSPCTLCEIGTWQEKAGAHACEPCPDGTNTTQSGASSSDLCLAMCPPGSFSSSGLAESPSSCTKCGAGAYQPQRGQTSCESCGDGKSTRATGAVFASECQSICGDNRRSTEEGCDDGNTYPGDGCDHECSVEPGTRCTNNFVGSASLCNKVVCGDNKKQNADDGSVTESCDDGNTEAGDGCAPDCVVEPGWKCVDSSGGKDAGSSCTKVVCGDGLLQEANVNPLLEVCDDGNTASGDGCSSECALEEGFICSTRKEGKSKCFTPVCGDGFREAVKGLAEACDDGNSDDGDGCSGECSIEAGFACEPHAGTAKRPDVHGVGEWSSAGRDNCTRTGAAPEGKKEGGFFGNLFGSSKKEEV